MHGSNISQLPSKLGLADVEVISCCSGGQELRLLRTLQQMS